MSTEIVAPESGRHRLLIRGLLRSLASAVVVVGLYFLGPFDALRIFPLGVALALAGILLAVVAIWQIRAILRSPYPGIRGIEALAITAPLYLILFAATYFLLSLDDPSNFSVEGLTRTDTLYFTVTTFSTVGYGDISAASQGARVLVTVQMILNLLVLGAGIQVFMGAVKRSRNSRSAETTNSPAAE